MDIFVELLPDAGLLLGLILSAIVIDFTLAILFRGMLRLKSFNLGILFNIHNDINVFGYLWFGLFMATILAIPLLLASYFFSSIFYWITGSLDLLDIVATSFCFSIFMFYYMECHHILSNIKISKSYKESGWTYSTTLEELDWSLTPAITNTLVAIMGMSISYYQFNYLF